MGRKVGNCDRGCGKSREWESETLFSPKNVFPSSYYTIKTIPICWTFKEPAVEKKINMKLNAKFLTEQGRVKGMEGGERKHVVVRNELWSSAVLNMWVRICRRTARLNSITFRMNQFLQSSQRKEGNLPSDKNDKRVRVNPFWLIDAIQSKLTHFHDLFPQVIDWKQRELGTPGTMAQKVLSPTSSTSCKPPTCSFTLASRPNVYYPPTQPQPSDADTEDSANNIHPLFICGICKKYFQSTPKLLACLHTFCEK